MMHSTNKINHIHRVLFGLLTLLMVCSALFTASSFAHPATDSDCGLGINHYHSNSVGEAPTAANAICPGNIGYTLSQTTAAALSIGNIINIIIGIVVSLAFLYFFWNLVVYIRDENNQEEAKKKMGWAVLAIVVITSLWGIVSFVRSVVGIEDVNNPGAVQLPSTQRHDGTSVFEARGGGGTRSDGPPVNNAPPTVGGGGTTCSGSTDVEWCGTPGVGDCEDGTHIAAAAYQSFTGSGDCIQQGRAKCTLCRNPGKCSSTSSCTVSPSGKIDYNPG